MPAATYPTTGGTYGSITLSGNGSYNLSPPTTGTYAGIVIFQTRDNSKALTLSGNASGMTGTVYAPAAQLAESGNAALNAALIVDTLTISGNGVNNTLSLSAPTGTVAYTPNQIRDAYGINNLSLDGTGQTIAIVDAYDDPSIFQALDAFDAQFTLTDSGPTLYAQYGPASSFLTVLNQYGQATSLPSTDPNGPGTDNWEVEEALDVEWAHAIAPGAQIILVEANSQSLSDLMASVATAASQPGVSVVSMSWGFPEGQAVFASDEATYDSVFQRAGRDVRRQHGRLWGGRSRVSRVLAQRGGRRRHEPHAQRGQFLQQRDGMGVLLRFRGGLHRLRRRHQPVRARAGVSAGRPVHGLPNHPRCLAGCRSSHRSMDRRPVQPRSQQSVRDRGRHELVGSGLGGLGGAGQSRPSGRGRVDLEQLHARPIRSKPSTCCPRAITTRSPAAPMVTAPAPATTW